MKNCRCDDMENTCNLLREERDELLAENYDLKVMLSFAIYLLGMSYGKV